MNQRAAAVKRTMTTRQSAQVVEFARLRWEPTGSMITFEPVGYTTLSRRMAAALLPSSASFSRHQQNEAAFGKAGRFIRRSRACDRQDAGRRPAGRPGGHRVSISAPRDQSRRSSPSVAGACRLQTSARTCSTNAAASRRRGRCHARTAGRPVSASTAEHLG